MVQNLNRFIQPVHQTGNRSEKWRVFWKRRTQDIQKKVKVYVWHKIGPVVFDIVKRSGLGVGTVPGPIYHTVFVEQFLR